MTCCWQLPTLGGFATGETAHGPNPSYLHCPLPAAVAVRAAIFAPRLLAAGLALLVSLSTLAREAPAIPGLDILPSPVDAEVSDSRLPAQQERVYPTGSVRKISGQLRYESSITARGTVATVTWLLPMEHRAGDAFDAAREALQQQGAQTLFWCEGRDCGESSLWANQVFGNARLYGADDRQSYLLLRLAEPHADSLVALYAITRGNRRAYLHAERFDAEAPLGELLPTSATLLRELKATGDLQLPRLADVPAEPWTTLLSRGLNLDATLRVSLSGPHAADWRDALVAKGVRSARLELDSGEVSGLLLKVIR